MAALLKGPLTSGAAATVLTYAVAGWLWCGALIGIGQQLMSMQATLIAHAIGAPLGYAVITLVYFRRHRGTGPLAVALIFVGTAIVLDVFVVALLIERSFAMFASPLGTWLPLASSFAVSWAVGIAAQRPMRQRSAPESRGRGASAEVRR